MGFQDECQHACQGGLSLGLMGADGFGNGCFRADSHLPEWRPHFESEYGYENVPTVMKITHSSATKTATMMLMSEKGERTLGNDDDRNEQRGGREFARNKW